jgi:hypothetical protein
VVEYLGVLSHVGFLRAGVSRTRLIVGEQEVEPRLTRTHRLTEYDFGTRHLTIRNRNLQRSMFFRTNPF